MAYDTLCILENLPRVIVILLSIGGHMALWLGMVDCSRIAILVFTCAVSKPSFVPLAPVPVLVPLAIHTLTFAESFYLPGWVLT